MFEIEDGRKYFYQWDKNRRLIVLDINITEAHYHISDKKPTISREVFEDNGVQLVEIPDEVLEKAGNFLVYGIATDYTAGEQIFTVKKKNKPE